ncbi:cardiolipin synthase [Cellulomonas aerilata]|uniref:Cardiolipin synthase n=1 Tax=Cellulomonas aerilata TaxID=515326 RepID=A0A512DBZ3_9CELL|nr:cardiolipin synthase [Cellulomonas aerilata]GEO33998.1 cardiolipin synthase [Cellulomonas aerilata]
MSFSWTTQGLALGGVLAALQVLLFLAALVVVPRDRRPSSALAWILLVLVLPLAGVLLFAVIGSPKLPRARRAKQRSMDARISRRVLAASGGDPRRLLTSPRTLTGTGSGDAPPEAPPWLASIARLNQRLGAMPLLDGNSAQLMSHIDEQLAALEQAVRGARRYVHVEFYILALDATTAPFFAALEDAVLRGVDVKVLLDHLGTRPYPGYRATVAELDRIGVQWHLMLPVQPLRGRYQRPDLRNHRKLVVIDGDVAFVGSLNVIDPGYGKRANRRRGLVWRDLLARVEGPVVHEIDALFVTDWFSETDELLPTSQEDSPAPPAGAGDRSRTLLCQVLPSGPGFETENNLVLFNSLIYNAERRLSITSPYFVPDESLLIAITTAARRGVQVELFVGEVGDHLVVFHAQHSYYRALLEAGVRIYLYPGPSILHAKHLSVDELVTVVGSSNMDIRSFDLDLEVTLMTCGRDLADQMRAVEDEYRAASRELTLEEWSRQSFAHGVVDGLARLTSAVQ